MPSPFKEKRLALEKELQVFADSTRVRVSHLRAIEECAFEKLPEPVYARGYIRDYARALGVDPSPVIAAYEAFLRGPEKSEDTSSADPSVCDSVASPAGPSPDDSASGHQNVTLTVEREIRLEEHKTGARSLKLSLAFFAVLVVVGAALIYHMYGSGGQQFSRQTVPDVIVKEPAKPADLQQKPAEAPEPVAALPTKTEVQPDLKPAEPQRAVSAAAVSVASGKKHRLALNATEKVWVQIILDKTEKKEMLMNPGDSLSFEAADSFRLWIGNSAGLKMSLDGKEVVHGGKSGQALRLVLPDTAGNQPVQKPSASAAQPPVPGQKPVVPKPATLQ